MNDFNSPGKEIFIVFVAMPGIYCIQQEMAILVLPLEDQKSHLAFIVGDLADTNNPLDALLAASHSSIHESPKRWHVPKGTRNQTVGVTRGPIKRRKFLGISLSGFAGISLPRLLQLRGRA